MLYLVFFCMLFSTQTITTLTFSLVSLPKYVLRNGVITLTVAETETDELGTELNGIGHCLGLCEMCTPSHNPIQPIFYRSRSLLV